MKQILTDEELDAFLDEHCTYPGFPSAGVKFIDIFPLLRRTKMRELEGFSVSESLILVPEARGFIFAQSLGLEKVVFLRKAGKLPGKVLEIPSHTEYSANSLYVQQSALEEFLKNIPDNGRPVEVYFFDDVLATGSTAVSIKKFIDDLEIGGRRFRLMRCGFYLALKALRGEDFIHSNYPDLPVEVVYRH